MGQTHVFEAFVLDMVLPMSKTHLLKTSLALCRLYVSYNPVSMGHNVHWGKIIVLNMVKAQLKEKANTAYKFW